LLPCLAQACPSFSLPLPPYSQIDDLISKVEEVYRQVVLIKAGALSSDSLHQLLHLPDLGKTFHNVAFRNGWYFGVILPAFVIMIYTIASYPERLQTPEFIPVTRIYAGYAVFVVYLWLAGFNLVLWKRYRINYVFIFDFDPSTYIEIPNYFELIGVLSVLVTYSYLLFVLQVAVTGFPLNYHPLLLFGVLLFMLLQPLNVFYRASRYWLVRVLMRILVAPFVKVEFRDFMTGDQLCSLVYLLLTVQYLFCVYLPESFSVFLCNQKAGGLTIILSTLPSWFRMLQSLRRYWDLRSRAHLVNAGKYFSAIMVSLFAGLNRIFGFEGLFVVWILICIFSAAYSSTWDVVRDWGFFEKDSPHRFLRKHMAYPHPWLYYLAIPVNFAFRCAWIVTLSENPANPTLRDFFLALVEALRRFQWNLYRLEYEHLTNMDKFRTTKHVPLTFHRPPTQHYKTIMCH